MALKTNPTRPKMLTSRRAGMLAAVAIGAALGLGPSSAQQATGPEAWREDLNEVLQEIAVTEERRDELRAEIAALDQDRAALNQELIETNQRVQAYEGELDAIEATLGALAGEEALVTQALNERRDVLAEVLAVLQRMGEAPPPALIVQPEDALAAVRGAILLGAVVPEVRAEAEALAADIERLLALRQEQEAERARIVAAANLLADDTERIELLVEERRQLLDQTEEALAAEQQRLGNLAAEAQTLEELIQTFEAGTADRPAAELAFAPQPGIEPGPPILLGDADRIAPAVPFASAHGLLPRPANGELVVGFGETDRIGAVSRGLTIATRAGARVSAPADGWIEFAGPYRSYGNLLIMDAGGGYRVVLAGMERIDVQQGQFVLAGEPIGAMRSEVAGVDGVAIGAARPELYLEFRRNGDSIDPSPWWADPF